MDIDQDLIREADRLPASPKLLASVIRLLRDPDANASAVADLIKKDSTISSKILKIGHSGYYSMPSSNMDIGRAILHIGLLETYRIVSGLIGRQMASQPIEAYNMHEEEFFYHSLCVAIANEKLAKRLHHDAIDNYTIGLFHSMGKLLVSTLFAEDYPKVIEMRDQKSISQSEAERTVLGCDFAMASAVLLEYWKFPESIYAPVKAQFFPYEENDYQEAACMLHFSLAIIDGLDLTELGSRFQYNDYARIMKHFYMDESDIEALGFEVRSEAESFKQLFDLE